MGTLYVFNRTILDDCASAANTVFLYLGSSPLDYVEVGTRQFGSQVGKFHLFYEYQTYPNDDYYADPTLHSNSQYVSFNVSNLTGHSYIWKTEYSFGTSQSGWTTFNTTPYSNENYGTPHTEISRYGNADASTSFSSLKHRPSSGGWYSWGGVHCSPTFPNSIPDWDAYGDGADSWYTQRGSPTPPDC